MSGARLPVYWLSFRTAASAAAMNSSRGGVTERCRPSADLRIFGCMQRGWRVLARGAVDPAQLASLEADDVLYVSGHTIRGGDESKSFFVAAGTAEGAKQKLRRALNTDTAVVTEATRLPYTVAVGVPEDEADAIDSALGDPWSRHLTGLFEREPADGYAEFLLGAVADSEEDAVAQVSKNYRSLRETAGLPPAAPEVLFVNPPWVGTRPQRHREHLARAEALLEADQPDFAVVIAQVAFEALVRQAVTDELNARGLDWLGSHIKFRSYSLAEDRQRRLWKDLLGDDIGRSGPWGKYKRHITRRNLVVHEGSPVDSSDAAESIDAVEAMIDHVETARRRRTS